MKIVKINSIKAQNGEEFTMKTLENQPLFRYILQKHMVVESQMKVHNMKNVMKHVSTLSGIEIVKTSNFKAKGNTSSDTS